MLDVLLKKGAGQNSKLNGEARPGEWMEVKTQIK